MTDSCEDKDLIRMAMLKATGADIHDVKGVIGYYRSGCDCLDRGPESPSQAELARALRRDGGAALADYLRHGDIKKAKKDHDC